MLNQKQSKTINKLKPLFIIPFLGLLLLGFNTKEVVKFPEDTRATISAESQPPNFESPLRPEDIERVIFGFGKANTKAGVKFHNGIDIIDIAGTTIFASADGIVKTASYESNNGNYIVLEHKNAYRGKYLHPQDPEVKEGDLFKTGDLIGHVGNTGKSKSAYLHFEILERDRALNPASFIPFTQIVKYR